MIYVVFAAVFFLSLVILLGLFWGAIFRPLFWQRNLRKIKIFCVLWFLPYAIFICFFTGPTELDDHPSSESSPYKLPWKAGVSRFVAQGNRSFTSHRGFHLYAWDFATPNGTQILAARAGRVVELEQSYKRIGLKGNLIVIEHEDGLRSGYAHIQQNGALVKVGDFVKQGQPIALSGMTGQTIFPHLHFYVTNKEQTASIPISFLEVPRGIPLAGQFYNSQNSGE